MEHLIAFLIGYILDFLFGDPYFLPHPIRAIGNMISYLEKLLLKEGASGKKQKWMGRVMVIIVCTVTFFVTGVIWIFSYRIHRYLGVAIEAIMTYQVLAARCLKVESMKVYDALNTGTLADARRAVSMIVGRDTECLDEKGIIKACVETIAENTSDGVIAPMLYTALWGPVGGFVYKAMNTMDSMIGYKNDKYLNFGRCAAKLDDIVNFIPARISAGLMILSCVFLGKEYDAKSGVGIFLRDRYNHASPNSAQTESVCAGALGLRLAGDATYFGKVVKKPFIGDEIREIEKKDIIRANRMLFMCAFLGELFCLLMILIIW